MSGKTEIKPEEASKGVRESGREKKGGEGWIGEKEGVGGGCKEDFDYL